MGASSPGTERLWQTPGVEGLWVEKGDVAAGEVCLVKMFEERGP